MKKYFWLLYTISLFTGLMKWSHCDNSDRNNQDKTPIEGKNIIITIVYDNNTFAKNVKSDWGFSCLITGYEKTILFDTGGDGSLLMNNLHQLNIDPHEIDAVFLSHHHRDHTGGLDEFLKVNSEVTVYLPGSFPPHFKENVILAGAKLEELNQPREIIRNVYSSGEMGTDIIEQSLILSGPAGLVVVTGCAHPGIINIIRSVKDQLNDEILLVLGGFHLIGQNHRQITSVVSGFKLLGVQNVAPCHCSGNESLQQFAAEYKKNFINCGVGKVIQYCNLQ
jgi:7,8-dihydropterin-6-yl-methyl-4-(beta-D-ribofuranosyl)aminobenzene 5'-phosphate synthase